MLTLIIVVTLGLLVVAFVALSAYSWHAERLPANKEFNAGKIPAPALEGDYKGTFSREVSWQGKSFDAKSKSGVNNFAEGQKYPFKTYDATSLKSDKKVLKIDYNQPENPLWLKFIVDELTEVGPEKYQGKVFIKLGPLAFTLTYFQLDGNPPINADVLSN